MPICGSMPAVPKGMGLRKEGTDFDQWQFISEFTSRFVNKDGHWPQQSKPNQALISSRYITTFKQNRPVFHLNVITYDLEYTHE